MNDDCIIINSSTSSKNGKVQEDDAHLDSSACGPTADKKKDKKKPAIRHAEKRRTSTCRFADRVANISVDHYKATIPIKKRPPQTCIATIVAHYRKNDDARDKDHHDLDNHDGNEYDNNGGTGKLWVLSMGVGTKFLSESCLRQEMDNEKEDGYGSRVRDMHAEVLARRAFRRQLTLEIREDLCALEKEQTKSRSSLSVMNTVPPDRFGQRNDVKDKNLSILIRSKDTSPERREDGDSAIRYMLRPGVTLHMYTSSAPCGNATLKKFCKMSKERFRDDLGLDEWPDSPHEPPPGHSIKLGEFSLLVKEDKNQGGESNNHNTNDDVTASIEKNSSPDCSTRESGYKPKNTEAASQMQSTIDKDVDLLKTKKRTRNEGEGSSSQKVQSLQSQKSPKRKGKPWPATLSDDWAPPGTTIVGFQHKGSIHTCSDKICRWNYLGLQGSLLASFLEEPLYLSTLTVGRKLSGSVCRRAICCRLDTRCRQPKFPTSSEKNVSASSNDNKRINENKYRVNHPAVMGTSVYLDTGVVDTSNVGERGQDVRFHSSFVWSWWQGPPECGNISKTHTNCSDTGLIECIESSSGLLAKLSEESTEQIRSVAPKVSTKELTFLFLEVYHQALATRNSVNPGCDPSTCKSIDNNSDDEMGRNRYNPNLGFNNTLSGIREIKKRYSPMHENFKDLLLTEHKVLSQWRRRKDRDICITCTISS